MVTGPRPRPKPPKGGGGWVYVPPRRPNLVGVFLYPPPPPGGAGCWGGAQSSVRDQQLLTYAKRLRTEQTPLEQKLWHALRAKRFEGAKFRRQVVIGRYIADFACRTPGMLVIEVDGDTHGATLQYDSMRTSYLESRGYRVLRFTNCDVGSNLEGVLTMIAQALDSPLSPALSPEGERE
jgi:very-short-patch-repair endonuclease